MKTLKITMPILGEPRVSSISKALTKYQATLYLLIFLYIVKNRLT